ncbi:hypothetical protein FV140_14635 [Paenarthrobacter ureafaciens]|uniref:Uncharacterized protein n=1 Tax=Paenarthrobacter ureafaciens TaxID=37931 RepID=A0AAX3EE63_PAEUR|nr:MULTISPECIES: hypothetical protein [Paenarthrobacter]MDO5876499.1 hypothetical protein [Paenarthrobacter sp. SD-1]QMU83196.1 hypothetical protein FV140_14635 [Paenarthrobacter ureafaciens]UYV96273.1 hypothetical protein NL394_14515 [Paenarthrobacter ureafaciens]
MAAITAPWALEAAARIREPHRQVLKATAYPVTGAPFDLDVLQATVTLDESWSPRIQASLSCEVPADKAQLAALDPRKRVRVKVYAGYQWNSVSEDVQLLADLHLRNRDIKRPDNTLELRLASDEALAQDYKRQSWDTQPPTTNLLDFVTYHANIASIPETIQPVLTDFVTSFGASSLTGVVQEPGKDSWSLLADAQDRAGCRIYVDGNRRWHIERLPKLGVTALNLTIGVDGIITESSATLSREDFKNAVTIKYAWRDGAGNDQVIYGNCFVNSGEFATSAIGFNVYYLERSVPATQAQADAAAKTVLTSVGRRGNSYSITALNAFWLTPGSTVTATLPEGDQRKMLVSSVSFNYPSGEMSLKLRQPEDLSTAATP